MLRQLLLSLALALAWAAPAAAQISVVQVASGSGNDVAVTFGGAWGASNHIIAVIVNNNDAETVSITGVSTSVTTILANTDTGTQNAAVYCWPGDGSDTSFTATTSSGSQARVAAAEFSGGSCDVDGTPGLRTGDNASPYNLSPLYTTTTDGSLLIGLIISTSVSDYTVVSGTFAIPADQVDIGTIALGGYKITTTAGTYDLPFESSPDETSMFVVAAVKPASAGGTPARLRMLLGIGSPR